VWRYEVFLEQTARAFEQSEPILQAEAMRSTEDPIPSISPTGNLRPRHLHSEIRLHRLQLNASDDPDRRRYESSRSSIGVDRVSGQQVRRIPSCGNNGSSSIPEPLRIALARGALDPDKEAPFVGFTAAVALAQAVRSLPATEYELS
jgi:hypothetical protein